MASRRPNVVTVICDDLGYGDLGCFGAPYVETPTIDRMAREGLRLTDFHVAAPRCTPSRAAYLTGRYPRRFDLADCYFPDDASGLPAEAVTLASVLDGAGYATHCVGKWHLGHREPHRPIDHGFDSYYGVPYSNDMYTSEEPPDPDRWPAVDDDVLAGEDHALQAGYPPLPLYRDGDIVEQPVDQSTLTRRYTEEAVDVIEECAAGDDPFFLYLAHNMPHPPLHASGEFRGTSRAGLHGDVLAEIDWSVRGVLSALADAGIEEETLVFFSTDHGAGGNGGSNGPFREGKGTVWEGGMHVPAVLRWPGSIPAGSACSELVTGLDLLPTVASLAGAGPPRDRTVDGQDCSDLLLDPGSATSPQEYFCYHSHVGEMAAIRNREGWKLRFDAAWGTLDDPQLYHLPTDPGESDDLADSNPGVLDRLQSRAERAERRFQEGRPVGDDS